MAQKIISVQFPILHEGQRAIHDARTRFRVLACGRRFGKTELGAYELGHRMIRGQLVAYFAPSYKMTMETYRLMMYRVHPLITSANRNEGRIELLTRGVLDFWSLSTTAAESVRGRKYHFVVIDEAALVVGGMQVWDEVIRPLLVDYQGGALFLSTPKGRNYFYDLYQRGLDPLESEWESFNYPSLTNPIVTQCEIEAAKRTTLDRAFKQEYEAEFLEDAGTVFRGVTACSTLDMLPGPEVGRVYTMGIDWGRHNDFTVVSIYDATTHRQVFIDRFNIVDWNLQRGRIEALCVAWKPATIYAEANSIGEVNIEELMKAGIMVTPFYTTSRSKPLLIDNLALAIEKHEIGLLNDPVQIAELQSYESIQMPSGYFAYNAPPGAHDDTVIALALSYAAARDSVGNYMMVQATLKGRQQIA